MPANREGSSMEEILQQSGVTPEEPGDQGDEKEGSSAEVILKKAGVENSRISDPEDAHEIANSGKHFRDRAQETRNNGKATGDKEVIKRFEKGAKYDERLAERNEKWTTEAISLAREHTVTDLESELADIRKRRKDDADWDLEVREIIVEKALEIKKSRE